MFGPNTTLKYTINITSSHRDKYFIDTIKRLKDIFKRTFNLNGYDILFIPGSGTTGVESIFFSLLLKIKVIGNPGVFFDKWTSFASIYNTKKLGGFEELYCQLETSNSKSYNKKGCIVDAVSSFPYFEMPNDTKIMVTASNKILGSMPGCAIVLVKYDFWDYLISSDIISTFNLNRYKYFLNFNQTPTTPPMQIFDHLLESLQKYDIERIRDKIINNSRKIVDSLSEENIIGEKCCPVITVPKNCVPLDIAKKYEQNICFNHYKK